MNDRGIDYRQLTEFVRARLDEVEAAALATRHVNDGAPSLTWKHSGARHLKFDNSRSEDYSSVMCGPWDRILVARDTINGAPLAKHIAAWGPATVLADVATKRAIVDDCELYLRCDYDHISDGLASRTLQRLAMAWSGHGDYQRAWKRIWPGCITGREVETW